MVGWAEAWGGAAAGGYGGKADWGGYGKRGGDAWGGCGWGGASESWKGGGYGGKGADWYGSSGKGKGKGGDWGAGCGGPPAKKPRLGGGSAALAEQVEAFIAENDIDERAIEALRGSSPASQQFVLDRGSLADARNPSAAVLGRLKDAAAGGSHASAGGGGAAWYDASSMGGMADYWGPAAAAGYSAGGGGKVDSSEVEQFISENLIDERASTALREAPPSHQRFVLERGGLGDARNPSASVLGRLRDAQKAGGSSGGAGGYGADAWSAGYGGGWGGSGGGKGGAFGGGKSDWGDAGHTAPQSMDGPYYAAQAKVRSPEEVAMEVETFILENQVDESASEALRQAPVQVQAAILERGGLTDARNPSSALTGRLRDATRVHSVAMAQTQKSASASPFSGGGGTEQVDPEDLATRVETFILENMLDERASDALREASPAAQVFVLERGGLSDARNPSAALLGRLRDSQTMVGQGGKGGAWGATAAYDVQNFAIENQLDERATEVLTAAAPAVQRMVLERGSLLETRNPSSALLGRLREAQATLLGGGSASAASGGGSWGGAGGWGSSMGGYGGYDASASWGYSAPKGASKGASKGGAKGGAKGYGGAAGGYGAAAGGYGAAAGGYGAATAYGAATMDPQTFIAEASLDDRATEAFLSSTPEVQHAVMERGSLRDARNPSAALLGRLKTVMTGGGFMNSPTGPAPGREELEAFIRDNQIDERAQEALYSAPPSAIRFVLERGGLQDTRNPSSAVLARLRDANQAMRG